MRSADELMAMRPVAGHIHDGVDAGPRRKQPIRKGTHAPISRIGRFSAAASRTAVACRAHRRGRRPGGTVIRGRRRWFAAPPPAPAVRAAPSSAAPADKWSLPATAVVGADSSFKAVDAISPTDAWAVGATQLYAQGQLQATLVEHWDGTRWSVVP